MKAATRKGYGSPSIIKVEEIEVPKPKAHEILVKIMATTVNRTDQAVLTGSPFIIRFFVGFPSPEYKTTGTDFAGIVTQIGAKVNKYKIGDKVWGFYDHGLPTHAQYACLPTSSPIEFIPDGLEFEDAVCFGEGFHYAVNFINKVKLIKGQKALVYGATGGIGSALIQLLKYYDIEVDAVCGTGYEDLVKSLGATTVFDYQKEDINTIKTRYDYVFDAVGKSEFRICKKLLLPKGIYISSELGPKGENIYLPLLTMFSKGHKVKFPIPTDIPASLKLAMEMYGKGKLKSVKDKSYTIDNIAEGFHYVMSGKKIGNVIVNFD
jgi:NADPH:quinone reductase-like Zn-dependent oxidoreductase